MSSNPLYDALEDAVVGHLEQTEDSKLPEEFAVSIPGELMDALICHGLHYDGKQIARNTTRLTFVIAGKHITVEVEK